MRKAVSLLVAIFLALPVFAQSGNLILDFSNVPSHPRLLMKQGEEIKLMENIRSNKDLLKLHKGIIASADSILKLPRLERVMTGKRLLSVTREAIYRLDNLAYAYRMTGDEKYSKGARDEMVNLCSFTDWNPSHYLDVGEGALAVSLAYDWIYPTLSQEDRKFISENLWEKAIKPSYTTNAWFWLATNNWNQVCNAGMVWAALAFYEDHPDESQKVVEKSYISNHLVLPCYAPDGCYPEGFGYWEYGTQFQVMMNEAFESVLGSAKCLSASGFLESIDFINYMSSPIGKCFNYSDGGSGIGNVFLLYWFAAKWEDPSGVYLENKKLAALPDGYKSKDRFFPIYLIFMARHPELLKMVKPSKNSWKCGGSQELYLYRSGWDSPKDTYFGIKAGTPSLNHAHMDCGTFVYDYAGTRWSVDLGSQDYNSLESKGMDIWNMSQGSERWSVFRYNNKAHSVFTLNDDEQRVLGKTRMVKTFDDNRHGAVIDLTDVYSFYVKNAVRTAWVDNDGFLTVEDDITASDSQDVPVMWVLNTVDGIKITGKKTAEIKANGVTMVLTVESPVPIEMKTWSNAPTTDYDAPNPGTARVGFTSTIPASKEATFKVTLKRK